MKKSIRSAFKASPKLETEGIFLELANTRIRLARAGGSNEKYNAAMTLYAEKHKRAMANNLISEKAMRRILYEVYAEHVVLEWFTNAGTEEKPDWKEGIESDDGSLMPVTFENIVGAFEDLPEFFLEVKTTAESIQFFREDLISSIAGN